jgi:hypothetical protein
MNYCNYEGKIVEKYGVALKGWPGGSKKVCNPSMVGSQPLLDKLYSVLVEKKCHWVRLTDDELDVRKANNQAWEDRGEVVYKARKTPSRIHKQQRQGKSVKSKDIVEDSEDEDEEPEVEGDNQSHSGRDNADKGSNGMIEG